MAWFVTWTTIARNTELSKANYLPIACRLPCQHDSSIYTTNQTATRVKLNPSKLSNCSHVYCKQLPGYTMPAFHLDCGIPQHDGIVLTLQYWSLYAAQPMHWQCSACTGYVFWLHRDWVKVLIDTKCCVTFPAMLQTILVYTNNCMWYPSIIIVTSSWWLFCCTTCVGGSTILLCTFP